MVAPMVDVNYLAVLVAAVASMAIGGLWYSPLLFGKIWMKLSGMDEKKIAAAKKKGMAASYVAAYIDSAAMAYVLAHFAKYAGAATPIEGAMAGFWAWLGFVVPLISGTVLWEGKPINLFILKIAHYLVALLVMGAIVAAWH